MTALTPILGHASMHYHPVGAVIMGRVKPVPAKRVAKKARKRRRTVKTL
jgi:hypothetical protein